MSQWWEDPDGKMNAANAMAPASQEEFDEMMAANAKVLQIKIKAGNCECGNQCYLISEERVDGKYRVWREHAPADCPHDCEDCEQEALG